MKCKSDIEKLAKTKLEDAAFLLADGRYDSAYYLAGYTIELLLKAKVCKTLNIDNFFDEKSLKSLKYPQTFKIHDVNQLLLFSGMFQEFMVEISANPTFKLSWSIVSEWSEEARYTMGRSQTDAQNLVTPVKEISTWIEKRL